MTLIAEWSLPVLMSTHKTSIIFSFSSPAEEGERWSSFGGHLMFNQIQPQHIEIGILKTNLP